MERTLTDSQTNHPASSPFSGPTSHSPNQRQQVRTAEEAWAPTCADDPRPLIPPSSYLALCTHAKRFRHPLFKREIIAFRFQLVDGPFVGTELERFYPATKRVGRNSAYLREWVCANQDVQPRRRDRLPLNKFVGKVFMVQVDTVERTWDGRRHPRALQYSKVAAILDLQATNERVGE